MRGVELKITFTKDKPRVQFIDPVLTITVDNGFAEYCFTPEEIDSIELIKGDQSLKYQKGKKNEETEQVQEQDYQI